MTTPNLPASQERFHKHLDTCRRCREQPFNLCEVGDGLLRATGIDDALSAIATAYPADQAPGKEPPR